MKFTGTVELGGKTATGIEVPAEVITALGKGNRPAVAITINGHTYRTTAARMSGRFLVPLSAENRAAADVAAGDEVTVEIVADAAPREVEVPPDLATALAEDVDAQHTYELCAPSHKKEWVRWIVEAKKPETRATRITKTIDALREGKKTR